MSQIFVSCSRKDLAIAERIIKALAICQCLQGDVESAISLGERSLQFFDQIEGGEKSVVQRNLVRWKEAFQKE